MWYSWIGEPVQLVGVCWNPENHWIPSVLVYLPKSVEIQHFTLDFFLGHYLGWFQKVFFRRIQQLISNKFIDVRHVRLKVPQKAWFLFNSLERFNAWGHCVCVFWWRGVNPRHVRLTSIRLHMAHVSIQPELRYSTYRLLLHVRIGSLPAQKLLLDTGSSTVAFCNMTLPSTLPGANQTQFKACEQHLADDVGAFLRDLGVTKA